MDFRQYDNSLGRFYSIDALAEFGNSYSPYRFAYNNPVYFGDPTGLLEDGNSGSNALTGWVNQGGKIFWDPDVNNQADARRLHGDTANYVPDNTVFPNGDGTSTQYNPDGTKTTILHEVIVKVKPKEKPKRFYGADVRIISEFWGGGSYFAGGINVPRSMWYGYTKKGLNSYYGRFLMHEYGHFLQNKYGGSFWYMYPAVSSIVNAWISNIDKHSRHWAEIQASTMSYYYFGFPSGFQEDKNIVMPNYISDELKIELYNGYLKNK